MTTTARRTARRPRIAVVLAAAAARTTTTDLADLNQALRRNINSARGYQPPIELTAERLHATR